MNIEIPEPLYPGEVYQLSSFRAGEHMVDASGRLIGVMPFQDDKWFACYADKDIQPVGIIPVEYYKVERGKVFWAVVRGVTTARMGE